MSLIYCRLSCVLAMLPASTGQIADALGVARDTVTRWLRQLRAEGIVSPGEFRQRDGRVYRLVDGLRYRAAGAWDKCAGVRRFAAAWRALKARCTSDDLAAATSAGRRTANEILVALRRSRLARICGWEMRGKSVTPIYDRLPLADAPRPGRTARSEVNAAYWARRRDQLQGQAA